MIVHDEPLLAARPRADRDDAGGRGRGGRGARGRGCGPGAAPKPRPFPMPAPGSRPDGHDGHDERRSDCRRGAGPGPTGADGPRLPGRRRVHRPGRRGCRSVRGGVPAGPPPSGCLPADQRARAGRAGRCPRSSSGTRAVRRCSGTVRPGGRAVRPGCERRSPSSTPRPRGRPGAGLPRRRRCRRRPSRSPIAAPAPVARPRRSPCPWSPTAPPRRAGVGGPRDVRPGRRTRRCGARRDAGAGPGAEPPSRRPPRPSRCSRRRRRGPRGPAAGPRVAPPVRRRTERSPGRSPHATGPAVPPLRVGRPGLRRSRRRRASARAARWLSRDRRPGAGCRRPAGAPGRRDRAARRCPAPRAWW